MAVWFSSAAVVARLGTDPTVPPGAAGWLKSGVQAGFALGTAGSAALSLPDRFDPRQVFRMAALRRDPAAARLVDGRG